MAAAFRSPLFILGLAATEDTGPADKGFRSLMGMWAGGGGGVPGAPAVGRQHLIPVIARRRRR